MSVDPGLAWGGGNLTVLSWLALGVREGTGQRRAPRIEPSGGRRARARWRRRLRGAPGVNAGPAPSRRG